MALLDSIFGGQMPDTAGMPMSDPMSGTSMPGATADPFDPTGELKKKAMLAKLMGWQHFPAVPGAGIMGGERGAMNPPAANPAEPTPLPPTNDPMAREPEQFVNGVPLPRQRPMDDPRGDVETPAAAQPTSYSGRPATADVLTKIMGNLTKHAPTLLALGAGFAGAPSFGTGMSRAFSGAAPAVANLNNTEIKQGMISSSYRAMIAAGVPPEQALLMAMNPEYLKQAGPKYLKTDLPKFGVVNESDMGVKQHGFADPHTMTTTIPGQALPPNLQNQPAAAKRQLAPEGWTGTEQSTGRAVIKRGGQWLYTDDNTPVPK